jgi:hypothetical protein
MLMDVDALLSMDVGVAGTRGRISPIRLRNCKTLPGPVTLLSSSVWLSMNVFGVQDTGREHTHHLATFSRTLSTPS